MASASVVVEAILMIAAIITASIFASSFFTKLLELKDAMNSMVSQYRNRLKTELMIIYATYLKDRGYFAIYAMNIGKSTIYIERISIYFGNSTLMNLYMYDYDAVLEPGEWFYEEVSDHRDRLWEPGETIVIYLLNQTTITPPYIVKLVLPNGYSVNEVFAPLT